MRSCPHDLLLWIQPILDLVFSLSRMRDAKHFMHSVFAWFSQLLQLQLEKRAWYSIVSIDLCLS